MTNNIESALHYAVNFGWAVFPCDPDKKPLCKWRDESTTDPERTKELWTRHPGANIGLDCGKSGLIVLDVDTKNGADGYASLAELHKRADFSTESL